MKRFMTLGCVAALLAATPVAAQAADVVRPAYRTAAGLVYNWTGFYAGAHVGFIDTDNDSGVLGGGQIGFNHQVGQWVFGVEGDISATSIGNSVNLGWVQASGSLDWVSTFAGRFGYAFDRWLVYGKLGAAWAHTSWDISSPLIPDPRCCASGSDTSSGWMLGFGTEYALRNNWSAKVEYNMMDFNPGTIHVVKAGVNYRFNLSDPFRY